MRNDLKPGVRVRCGDWAGVIHALSASELKRDWVFPHYAGEGFYYWIPDCHPEVVYVACEDDLVLESTDE